MKLFCRYERYFMTHAVVQVLLCLKDLHVCSIDFIIVY